MTPKKLLIILINTILLSAMAFLTPKADSLPQTDPTMQCTQGTLYVLSGQPNKALRFLEPGFEQLQQDSTADKMMLGVCGVYTGMVRMSIGDYNQAIAAWHVSLAIFEDTGDAQLQTATLYGIGSAHMMQGQLEKATLYLEQALKLSREPSDSWYSISLQKLVEGMTLNNLGIVQIEVQRPLTETISFSSTPPEVVIDTQFEAAREYLEDSLEILQTLKQPITTNNNPDQTTPLDSLLQDLFNNPDINQAGEIDLTTIPNLLDGLIPEENEPETEALNPEEAMLLLQTLLNLIPDQNGENTLDNFEGLSPFLDLFNNLNPGGGTNLFSIENMVTDIATTFEPIVLNNIGETYRLQNNFEEALGYFEQTKKAIEGLESNNKTFLIPGFNPVLKANVLNSLGLIYYGNQKQQALDHFQQAEQIFRSVNHRRFLTAVLANIAELNKENGDLEAALANYLEAIKFSEEGRRVTDAGLTNIIAAGELNSSTIYALSGSSGSFVDIYKEAITLSYQLAEGKTVEEKEILYKQAFQLSECSRARLFLDMLINSQLKLTDPEVADLLVQEQKLYTLYKMAEDALLQAKTMNLPFIIADLEDELGQAKEDYEQILTEMSLKDNYFLNLFSNHAKSTGNGNQSICGGNQIIIGDYLQNLLDANETVVSYYISGDKSSLAFIISSTQFDMVELPQVNSVRLTQQTTEMKENLNLSEITDVLQPLQDLYNGLIYPLNKYLNTSTSHLIIIPHQQLHYVPFAALHDGTQYLGEKYTTSFLPSASILPLIQNNLVNKPQLENTQALVFGLGAPEYKDLQILKYANEEAETVAELFNVPVYTDNEATEEELLSQLNNAQVIHLAAHGKYDSVNPLESAVFLASSKKQDGPLQVYEIINLNLPVTEMVVLSACETNAGEPSLGDEVVSLTRAFFTAGSPTVITSLWTVDDESTRMLMEAFYRYWLGEKLSKGAALQKAQAYVRENGKENPYYWAAFVLNGDPGNGNVTLSLPEPTPTPEEPPITANQKPTSTVIALLNQPDTSDIPNEAQDPSTAPEETPQSNNSTGCLAGIIFMSLVVGVGYNKKNSIRSSF